MIKKFHDVPTITQATEKKQAMACILLINDWKLWDKVQGLVLDTTELNTNPPKEAFNII